MHPRDLHEQEEDIFDDDVLGRHDSGQTVKIVCYDFQVPKKNFGQ